MIFTVHGFVDDVALGRLCVLAISVAALVALVIGGPVLKLKGHYLAMATLGFGTIIYRIFLASPAFWRGRR